MPYAFVWHFEGTGNRAPLQRNPTTLKAVFMALHQTKTITKTEIFLWHKIHIKNYEKERHKKNYIAPLKIIIYSIKNITNLSIMYLA